MHEKLKNTLRSIDILYISEGNFDNDYYLMPFRITCDKVILSAFDNAWENYMTIKPSIILLRVMISSIKAISFIKEVRQLNKKSTIIVLTSQHLEEELSTGLEGDIQKLLVHPITYEDFTIALEKSIDYNNLHYHINSDIMFEPDNSAIIIKDKSISLTQKETNLLMLLMKNKHRIVSYHEIEKYVWAENSMNRNTLTSIIRNIRKKAQSDDIIKNHSSQGYKIGG